MQVSLVLTFWCGVCVDAVSSHLGLSGNVEPATSPLSPGNSRKRPPLGSRLSQAPGPPQDQMHQGGGGWRHDAGLGLQELFVSPWHFFPLFYCGNARITKICYLSHSAIQRNGFKCIPASFHLVKRKLCPPNPHRPLATAASSLPGAWLPRPSLRS